MQGWVIRSRGASSDSVESAGTAMPGGTLASEAIEHWLALRQEVQGGLVGQIDAVLLKLRDALATIAASPLLRNDEIAQRSLGFLARAETIEDFDAELVRLALRASELNGRGAGSGPDPVPARHRPVRTLLKL